MEWMDWGALAALTETTLSILSGSAQALRENLGLGHWIAFLAGAGAAGSGARIAILGALTAVFAYVAPLLGIDLSPTIAGALEMLAATLVLAGVLQGALTSLLGEEVAGNVMLVALAGSVLLLVWKLPKGALITLARRIL